MTEIGLNETERKGSAELLNHLLADEYVLYTETRNYHWSVIGINFSSLHKFFEDQYEALNDIIDDVAERIRALGIFLDGSLTNFLKTKRIKENTGIVSDAKVMLKNLLSGHEAIIRNVRKDLEVAMVSFHDAGTNNFLTDLIEKHEKMAWMIRAHLE